MSIRPSLIALLVALPPAMAAQERGLSSADSALVGRILLAEDRRDAADPALAEGWAHADERLRVLARRARGRIADSVFAGRDSLPSLPAPTAWPEPSWRLRYRALAARRSECPVLRAALADSAWQVRLRSVDLVTSECAGDDAIAVTLRDWIDGLPVEAGHRSRGSVAWHAAAHAAVALARLRPDEARARLQRLTGYRQWQMRVYAARAAAVLSDTLRLQALARDPDDNVKEAAIEALASLGGHAFDQIYLEALDARGAQAVRVAAIALTDSPRPDAAEKASRVFEEWVARASASARDVRIALLAAAGRPPGDDRPPPQSHELPPDAVALALGADIRLRVTMARASGGGAFVVRLRGDVAPIMAARILALANSGYYNGLTWHRVEPDFVIQGGGPGANEYVGWTQFLRDELGPVPHVRGTVGMSTRGHDTGDAQWFINLKDNPRLGRDYTVFAEVIEGMDVVDGILESDVIETVERSGG